MKIYCHLWGNTTTFSTSAVLKAWTFENPRALVTVPQHRYSTKMVELTTIWEPLPYYYGGMTCCAFGRISPISGSPEIAAVAGDGRRLRFEDGTLIEDMWDESTKKWEGHPIDKGWVPIDK